MCVSRRNTGNAAPGSPVATETWRGMPGSLVRLREVQGKRAMTMTVQTRILFECKKRKKKEKEKKETVF